MIARSNCMSKTVSALIRIQLFRKKSNISSGIPNVNIAQKFHSSFSCFTSTKSLLEDLVSPIYFIFIGTLSLIKFLGVNEQSLSIIFSDFGRALFFFVLFSRKNLNLSIFDLLIFLKWHFIYFSKEIENKIGFDFPYSKYFLCCCRCCCCKKKKSSNSCIHCRLFYV